jgi:hypothetical protein
MPDVQLINDLGPTMTETLLIRPCDVRKGAPNVWAFYQLFHLRAIMVKSAKKSKLSEKYKKYSGKSIIFR